jgi:hypothetical protein
MNTVAIIGLVVVAIVAIVFGSQILLTWIDPCRGMFIPSETAVSAEFNALGAVTTQLNLSPRTVQELSERAQILALWLQGCCRLAQQGRIDIDKCLGLANNAEQRLAEIDVAVAEFTRTQSADSAARVRNSVQRFMELAPPPAPLEPSPPATAISGSGGTAPTAAAHGRESAPSASRPGKQSGSRGADPSATDSSNAPTVKAGSTPAPPPAPQLLSVEPIEP